MAFCKFALSCRSRRGARWVMMAALLLPVARLGAEQPVALHATALDRYLAKEDESYDWKVEKTIPGEGCTTFVINLTSQTWRGAPEVDRTLWQHWLVVVKPNEVQSDKAFLYISGGSNRDQAPDSAGEMILKMALATHSVTAELRMVPNQPLVLGGDGRKRVEDDFIAYTWDKFMTTGDETWPARLPMVKSAHRAMDAITELMARPEGGELVVRHYIVAGGSKRGWTTWLTGATDERVVAIVPAVIDVLNVRVSMRHHFEAYGFWSPAVGDYVRHKIVNREASPEYARLLAIEDPYEYRARLDMPKYIVNAAGDEFFLPDSSQFYFDELPGEKYLRYVPNTKHSLAGTDAREGIAAFYHAILTNTPRPQFSWSMESDGSIRVTTEDRPQQILVWSANNPEARDFRLDKIGKAYTSQPPEEAGNGVYVARVPTPEKGFTAYFVELTYDLGGPVPFKATTAVRVAPDRLPFAGALDSKPSP